MDFKTLGQKLKEYRRQHFPSEGLRAVAEKIPIHFVYLHRIETGLFKPSQKMLDKLCQAYNLSNEEKFELYSLNNPLPEFLQQLSSQDFKQFTNIYFRSHKKDDEKNPENRIHGTDDPKPSE